MKHQRKTRKITRVRNKRRSKNTRFVQKGGDAVNSLNTLTSRIKLPWTKFRGEMHLPGHNFTGPGTNLDRLNPDGTPKPWSKPVKLCPGKCISPRNFVHGSLMRLVSVFNEFTASPLFCTNRVFFDLLLFRTRVIFLVFLRCFMFRV